MSNQQGAGVVSNVVPAHVRKSQKNTVIVNADTTYITITEDKAENILMKNWDAMKAHFRWQTPLGILLSLLFGMATSDSREDWHGISRSTLEAVAWCVVVASGFWLVFALLALRKAVSIQQIIQQMKNASAE